MMTTRIDVKKTTEDDKPLVEAEETWWEYPEKQIKKHIKI